MGDPCALTECPGGAWRVVEALVPSALAFCQQTHRIGTREPAGTRGVLPKPPACSPRGSVSAFRYALSDISSGYGRVDRASDPLSPARQVFFESILSDVSLDGQYPGGLRRPAVPSRKDPEV